MTYDLQNHTYIFNIYIYTYDMVECAFPTRMTMSDIGDAIAASCCFHCCVVGAIPWHHRTKLPFLPHRSSATNMIADGVHGWSDYSWLHDFIRQKHMYQICIKRVVYLYLYQGLGERFHQVSFPNERCDNLILVVRQNEILLRSPLMWKVWSWRWVAIHKHDPQAERVRAGRARFRFCWRDHGKVEMYIYILYI